MKQKDSGIRQTIDILVGVVPTMILYGNFIFIGLIFGIKDILSLNNPIDQIFLISLGSIIGFAGLVLSFGKREKKVQVAVNSILICVCIFTAAYVIVSLYSEPDSPDSLIEKLYIAPLYGSLIVGVRRLMLNLGD